MKSTLHPARQGNKSWVGVLACTTALFLMTSCVKEVVLKQEIHPVFPVLNGLFYQGQPGSVFRLSYTTNPFSQTVPYPEGAQVYFYKNNVLSGITQPQAQGYCAIPENYLGSGDVLSVVAVLPEGDTLRAEDLLPQRSLVIDADFGDSGIVDEYGDIIYKLNVHFRDAPDVKNYYELFVLKWSGILYSDSSTYQVFSYLYQPNPVLNNEGDQDYEPHTMFFSDDLLDGQNAFFEQQFISTITSSRLAPGRPLGIAEPGTYLIFRNISESHYQFLKSWVRHRYTQKIGQGLANLEDAILDDYERVLFAPDPLPLYTNVENGLGVFVAANTQIIKLR